MVAPQSLRALVVNNKKEENAQIKALFEQAGYLCLIADSPESALKILEQELVSIMCVDLSEQGEERLKFSREIRRRKPEIGIIILSTTINNANLLESLSLGVENFIIRPIDRNMMQLAIISTRGKQKIAAAERNRLKSIDQKQTNVSHELEKSRELLEQNVLDTVRTFVGLLEIRDANMGTHSKRVATFTRALADKYDLNDRVKRDIEIGALLHDIGKIGIPDTILLKSRDFFSYSQLTLKERAIYQKHAIIGQEAVEILTMLNQVGIYIRHHHERFDGSGYPDKLKGFYIPLGARLICMADAYEKIIFGTGIKNQAETELIFLRYLKKHKGDMFDPETAGKMFEFLKELKHREQTREKRISVESLTPGMILARNVYTKSGVLLISQHDRVTSNDMERLNRFMNSGMIIDNVYIYESSVTGKVSKKAAVSDTTTKLESGLNNKDVEKAIAKKKDFAMLPEVNETIVAYMMDAKNSWEDIEDLIMRDPIISLRILRSANSAIYGSAHDITTMGEAVSYLGYKDTRQMITALPVLEKTDYEQDIFNRKAFWLHLLGCGVICRTIARHIDAPLTDEYFFAGLFHDIGKLVMDQLYPEKLRMVIKYSEKEAIFSRKAERLIFGQPHDEIGKFYLEKLNIPDVIVDAVKNHHSPMDSKVDPMITSAVHIADVIAHRLHIGESGEKTIPRVETFAEEKLRISLTDLEAVIPEFEEEIKQTRSLVFME